METLGSLFQAMVQLMLATGHILGLAFWLVVAGVLMVRRELERQSVLDRLELGRELRQMDRAMREIEETGHYLRALGDVLSGSGDSRVRRGSERPRAKVPRRPSTSHSRTTRAPKRQEGSGSQGWTRGGSSKPPEGPRDIPGKNPTKSSDPS